MKIRDIPKDIRDIKRLRQVLSVILKYEGDFVIDQLRLRHLLPGKGKIRPEPGRKEFSQAERIRHILEEVGGAFVKFGQVLSLRSDILPKEYIDELSRLQDEVKPFGFEKVRSVIESELRMPLPDVFIEFDQEPISSASVGQVHRAKLRDGTVVAVKVQRPNIEKIFREDIDVLYALAGLVEKRFNLGMIRPTEILQEFERYTQLELDYTCEARNIENFYTNFRHDRSTVVPEIYWKYTTSRVLVMSYIDGTKLKQIDWGKNPELGKAVASRLMSSILTQIFIHGVFHADPHPGNVLIVDNRKIALLDFGIVGHVPPAMRESLASLFLAVMNRSPEQIGENLWRMGILDDTVDRRQFESDMVEQFGQFYSIPLKNIRFSKVFHEITNITRKYRIAMPSSFLLLGKCMLTLEGTCMRVYPGFNPVEESRPFIKHYLTYRTKPSVIMERMIGSTLKLKNFIMDLPEQTTEFLSVLKKGDDYIRSLHSDLTTLTTEMDRSSNRIANALIITGLIIASSLVSIIHQPTLRGFPAVSLFGFFIAGVLSLKLVISVIKEPKPRG